MTNEMLSWLIPSVLTFIAAIMVAQMNIRDRRRERRDRLIEEQKEETRKREEAERREEAIRREAERKEEQARYAKSRLLDMQYADSIGTMAHCTVKELQRRNLSCKEVDDAAGYYLGRKHELEDFYKEQSVSNINK